jgi:3alpha(or 20beta)-hydroxysteroid dehydrogenase
MTGLLDGKVAIVTGAARGLGLGIARAFCEAGASVMLTDVLAEGEQSAATLREEGHKAEFLHHDVTDTAAWDDIVRKTVDRWGRLDSLINNAGINLILTIEESTVEDFRKIIDVNLLGPFRGTKAVIAAMEASGGGTITNISSNSTRKMVAQTNIYSATKAALANLSKTSAIHFARSGANIRVNSIHPGAHATNMILGGSGDPAPTQEMKDMLVAAIPMGRFGEPSEIGSTAVFLASNMASYITGAEIFVDGGAITG